MQNEHLNLHNSNICCTFAAILYDKITNIKNFIDYKRQKLTLCLLYHVTNTYTK